MLNKIKKEEKFRGEVSIEYLKKDFLSIKIDREALEFMRRKKGFDIFQCMRPPNEVPETVVSLGFFGEGVEAYSTRLEGLITPHYAIRIGEDKHETLVRGVSGEFKPIGEYAPKGGFEIVLEEEWEILVE
jgi:hypothetical protein